jgi:folate-dependent phosphoribosylglycinamide formyltransferase PurN
MHYSDVVFQHQLPPKTLRSIAASLICALHTGSQLNAIAEHVSGEKTMKVKNVIVISALVAAVALSACRREVVHAPMKLGADVAVETAAR